ncbi:hypothetical protein [Methylotenera sp.]|uniref:hypothetical protein n=1 Tax=Methylotenera sp. TaxID=2051956 RepID=UPI0024877A8D|nr:hypothetical protein [Methylotenera sp.]MDI1363147.1 hypothetical protein [Methylotenera sp.]
MEIRNVSAEDRNLIFGRAENVPFAVLETQFKSSFKDPKTAREKWDKLTKEYNFYTRQAKDWASSVNEVINIWNKLPLLASEKDIENAFSI